MCVIREAVSGSEEWTEPPLLWDRVRQSSPRSLDRRGSGDVVRTGLPYPVPHRGGDSGEEPLLDPVTEVMWCKPTQIAGWVGCAIDDVSIGSRPYVFLGSQLG